MSTQGLHTTRPSCNLSASFKAADVIVEELPESQRQARPSFDNLVFGHSIAEHMLEVFWSATEGWSRPKIVPVHNISLHPYAKVFHYAQELFEGMKAYKDAEGKVRLFRPDLNMKRMRTSAERLALPVSCLVLSSSLCLIFCHD